MGTVLFVGFMVFALVVIILSGVRRMREGNALDTAKKLADAGQPDRALAAILDAEARWDFNRAHDNPATRVAALDRLFGIVDLGNRQAQALGRPFDTQELAYVLGHLRHLLGTKEHYSWVDGNLKREHAMHVPPLMAHLNAVRARFRAHCASLSR